MRIFRERKFSSHAIDTPGRFTTQHAGESQLGKPELDCHLEAATFEYKASLNKDIHFTNPSVMEKLSIEIKVPSAKFCRWNVITQKNVNTIIKLNKCW